MIPLTEITRVVRFLETEADDDCQRLTGREHLLWKDKKVLDVENGYG